MRSKHHVWLTLFLAGTLLAAPGFAGEDFTLGEHVNVPGGERKMTFRLRGTTMREALQLIAETSNLNFVLDESVQGSVSLDFFQTPLNEILETLLYANGYRVQIQGKSYVIYKSTKYAQSVMRFVSLRFVSASALLPTLNDLLGLNDHQGSNQSGGKTSLGGSSSSPDSESAAAPAPQATPAPAAPSSGNGAPGANAATGAMLNAPSAGAAGGNAATRTPAAPAAAATPAAPAITPGAVGTSEEIPGSASNAQGAAADMFRLTIKLDPRSNRLVLSGPLDKVNQAEELVRRLDVLTPSQVFALNFITAPEAIDVLRASFFEGDRSSKALRTLTSHSPDFAASGPGMRPTMRSDKIDISQESPRFIPMPTQNALLVLGTTGELNLVSQVLKTIDKRRPQVLIKAQLVQMRMDDARNLGLTYGFGSRQFSAGMGPAAGAAQQGQGTFTFDTASVNALNLKVQLDALITAGRTKVLASPQLLAMDSRTSVINITDEVVDSVTTSTTLTAQGTGLTTKTYTKRPMGITLEITPRIDARGGVTMNVHPKVEAKGDVIKDANGDPVVTMVSTREYEAQEIYVRDGETIVIGGLISDDTEDQAHKIPLLGDLPFIGGLFSWESHTKSQNEVQIYITPEVLKDDGGKTRV